MRSTRNGGLDPAGHRVDAHQGPEEQRPDQHEVDVHHLVDERRAQAGVVPGAEVERPRRGDVEGEGQRREGQHLRHPGVEHHQQPPPRRRRQRPEGERDRRAERQGERHDHRQHHVLDHVDAQQRRVVDAQPRHGGKGERAHPQHHERQRPADGPAVAAAVQDGHPEAVEPDRPDGHHEGDRVDPPVREHASERESREDLGGVRGEGEEGVEHAVNFMTGQHRGSGCPSSPPTAIMAPWRQQLRRFRPPVCTGTTTDPAWSAWAPSSGSRAS